jgi:hypothetical protein
MATKLGDEHPPSIRQAPLALSLLHSEARCDRPGNGPQYRPCRAREPRPALRTLPLNSGWLYDIGVPTLCGSADVLRAHALRICGGFSWRLTDRPAEIYSNQPYCSRRIALARASRNSSALR